MYVLLAGVSVFMCGELLCKAHLYFPLCFEGVASSFMNTSFFLLRKAVEYLKATLPFSAKNLKPCYTTGLNLV